MGLDVWKNSGFLADTITCPWKRATTIYERIISE